MKGKSAKNKGNRFEYYLRDYFKKYIDVGTRKNLMSGAGYDKGDLRIPSLSIVIEAKNQKNIFLIKDWEQAKEQALGDDLPVLAIRNPRKKEFDETLIVLSLDHFKTLLVNSGGPDDVLKVEPTLNYEQRSAVSSLKNALTRVSNIFPDE